MDGGNGLHQLYLVQHEALFGESFLEAGAEAIPFILRELQKEFFTPVCFVVLYEITGVDHAKGEVTVEGARTKWIEWGRKSGLV